MVVSTSIGTGQKEKSGQGFLRSKTDLGIKTTQQGLFRPAVCIKCLHWCIIVCECNKNISKVVSTSIGNATKEKHDSIT